MYWRPLPWMAANSAPRSTALGAPRLDSGHKGNWITLAGPRRSSWASAPPPLAFHRANCPAMSAWCVSAIVRAPPAIVPPDVTSCQGSRSSPAPFPRLGSSGLGLSLTSPRPSRLACAESSPFGRSCFYSRAGTPDLVLTARAPGLARLPSATSVLAPRPAPVSAPASAVLPVAPAARPRPRVAYPPARGRLRPRNLRRGGGEGSGVYLRIARHIHAPRRSSGMAYTVPIRI